MTLKERRALSGQLFSRWKTVAGYDPLIHEPDGEIGSPGKSVGQALALWVEWKITPDKEDAKRSSRDYLLDALDAIKIQQFNVAQWYGEAVKMGLTDLPESERKAAIDRMIPPTVELLSVIRYNLGVLLAVLYEAQSTQTIDQDASHLDLHGILVDLERLRANTRPIENLLGITLEIENSFRKPQIPTVID